jgi:hypothetical protein
MDQSMKIINFDETLQFKNLQNKVLMKLATKSHSQTIYPYPMK